VSLYSKPEHYRRLFDQRTHDLPFWLAIARPRILEYGAGTGRVTLPLARAGHQVTAVDLSKDMLDELQAARSEEPEEVRSRVRIVHGNAREVSLGERFDLAICAFNGIAHHHTNEELLAFLAKAKEHAPAFAFDVNVPDPKLLAGASGTMTFHRDGRPMRAEETSAFDPMTQLLTLTTRLTRLDEDAPPEVVTLTLRQLFPQETALLLACAGLRILWKTSTFTEPGRAEPDLDGDAMAYLAEW
jgi:SAM-dependent methyltransferase